MKLSRIITVVAALLTSVACNGSEKQENEMEKGKALIVFFSHAGDNYAVGNIKEGNTKIVADYIKEQTGASERILTAKRPAT